MPQAGEGEPSKDLDDLSSVSPSRGLPQSMLAGAHAPKSSEWLLSNATAPPKLLWSGSTGEYGSHGSGEIETAPICCGHPSAVWAAARQPSGRQTDIKALSRSMRGRRRQSRTHTPSECRAGPNSLPGFSPPEIQSSKSSSGRKRLWFMSARK
jgi:hypothetical protein